MTKYKPAQTLSDQRRTRMLPVVAQDQSCTVGQGILMAEIEIPYEELEPGPRGYRVHVVDYDDSTGKLYSPAKFEKENAYGIYNELTGDPKKILHNPHFHAQNVYAIVMRTLSRFESALGRRVSWGFNGHQIYAAPHAFKGENAAYLEDEHALVFGYVRSPDTQGSDDTAANTTFMCLSHDIVVHETTHALLDGIRDQFTELSSSDQAALHEALSDVVALLSVFSLRDVVSYGLDKEKLTKSRINKSELTIERLKASVLFGLGEAAQGKALRRSIEMAPRKDWEKDEYFLESHNRGEILVAAVMQSFLAVWSRQLSELREDTKTLDRNRVVESGTEVADYLLTMCIRALDYTPPTHITFSDFLSAMLTADHEIRPDDRKFEFRKQLRETFAEFGILPASKGDGEEGGIWCKPDFATEVTYGRSRFEPLTRDREEVFRFVWENRKAFESFGFLSDAYTCVDSVRPCYRIAPDDGFVLRETVAEVTQIRTLTAGEWAKRGIEIPVGMESTQDVDLKGGLTILFDEFGRLKFVIAKPLFDAKDPAVQCAQSACLRYTWEQGGFARGRSVRNDLLSLHRARAMRAVSSDKVVW